MEIRPATARELDTVLRIYAAARQFMREQGNPDQWGDDYPPVSLLREDIEAQRLYLCVEGDEIPGVFYFAEGEDPTYRVIEEGDWLNDAPYGVIHRIAVAKQGRGVAAFCFDYAFEQCKNLKIDTHKDNLPMQRALEKRGFVRCGIIHLENGDERIAYQKIENKGV